MLSKLWSITHSLRLPSICILCKQFHGKSIAVCQDCVPYLPTLGPACQQCAYPLQDTSYLLCGHCVKRPPYFNSAVIGHAFEEPLRSLLHQFKYHQGLYLSSFLSDLMLETWHGRQAKSDCLVPVPMHPKKLKARGFNQAVILTKKLAQRLQLPYELHLIKKITNTRPQATLNSQQRQNNLRHAFHAEQVHHQHYTIVDDLLTTGNTANEIARILKKAGAKQVDIWCCARAIKGNSESNHSTPIGPAT